MSRAPTPPIPASSAAPIRFPGPPSRIDELFRSYEKKLPEPATLSEGNGASMKCERHGWATYTLLDATARKLPVQSDADLPRLVPWARANDPCLRQIAVQAIVDKIAFDSNRLSAPGMHDPEHYHFHDIMVALKRHLDEKKVAVPEPLIAGMMLDASEKDFWLMKGKWEEDAGERKNFRTSLELETDLIRVTSKHTTPDPAWPDRTSTTKIKEVRVNERGQFVLAGEWDMESNANGYRGEKIEPSDSKYVVWPISKDLIWFDEGGRSWHKLRRAGN